MHLKRLEIFGFKSFADKLEIVFPQGITAVVGPNGSGKSNISDALRWVLGEQSIRSLRGVRTEDVIFAGSEQRKPLGMAEVTLVLDNSDGTLPLDFSEVSVTRRVYRSGESDFLINKTPVRLREIQDLFMDTGLGREAYSVIGQGKIDSILSARSEERRAVFEEAAGIMRYKNKKAVAVGKLDGTEASLLRINDIIVELEGQMGPLAVQAAVTRQYLELAGTLQRLEVNCYGKEIDRLSGEEARLGQELEKASVSLAEVEGAETVDEAALEEARSGLSHAADQTEALQDRLAGVSNALEKSSGTERLLLERKSHMQSERARLEKAAHDSEANGAAFERELEAEQVRLEELSAMRATREEAVAQSERALAEHASAIAALNDRAEELKRQIVQNLSDAAKARHDANSIDVEQEFLQRQQAEDTQRLEEAQEALNAVEHRMTRLLESRGEKEEIRSGVIEGAKRVQLRLSDADTRQTNLKTQCESTAAKAQKLDSRRSALEEMEQAHQGYAQGVRSVFTESPHRGSASLRGTVADLVKVKSGFETALEVALGSSLQSIVVESERNARDAIEWLRKTERGRATFLPLDMIEGRERRIDGLDAALKQFGAQPATAVLDYDPQYNSVLVFLLGNTMVAPDLEKAVGLSRRLNKAVRVVTLAGDVVNQGGSMSGGSRERKGSGILERKAEIETLNAEWQAVRAELAQLEQALKAAAAEREDCQNELQDLLQKKQQHDLEIARLDKEQEGVATERQRVTAVLEQINAAARSRNRQSEELAERGRGLATKIEQLEVEGQSLEEELRRIEADIRARQGSKEGDYRALADMQAALAAARQDELNSRKNCETLHRNADENRVKVAGALDEFGSLAGEMQKIEDELAAELARRSEMEVQRLQVDEQIRELRARRAEMSESLRRREDELRDRRKSTTDLAHRAHRLELRLNNLRNEAENLRAHLTEQYGTDWAAELDPSWDGTLSAHRPEIERLKGEVKALGPVNLGAVEEHDRVQERYDFLKTQYEDLVQAKMSLMRVIDEIEHTTTRRFMDTFTQVREAFVDVFNKLFEGGKADLFLIEPERPLESGIEIVAQPPGKRQQSLTLLSGGERALTAIALLFAILRVKPTPFCILDEIDATLDEANVHRFAELLSDFSREVQFIVVTHRRGTMELGDALYGVTMEEMGISKLMSLQLKKKAMTA